MSAYPGAPLFDDGAEDCLADVSSSNAELLASLRSDENSDELHEIAVKDARLHRMSAPMRATEFDTSRVCSPTLLC